MSRPVSMTYPNPGGETVTTSYNPQGLPATMSGSSSYVSNASYDALGRIELLPLGANGRRVDYVYYPWNQLQGQGRLQQIKTGPVGSPTAAAAGPDWAHQVREALVGLGWSAKQAEDTVEAITPEAGERPDVSGLLRTALQRLART